MTALLALIFLGAMGGTGYVAYQTYVNGVDVVEIMLLRIKRNNPVNLITGKYSIYDAKMMLSEIKSIHNSPKVLRLYEHLNYIIDSLERTNATSSQIKRFIILNLEPIKKLVADYEEYNRQAKTSSDPLLLKYEETIVLAEDTFYKKKEELLENHKTNELVELDVMKNILSR